MMILFSVFSVAAIASLSFSMTFLFLAMILSLASSALLTSAGEGPPCTLYVSISLCRFVHATISELLTKLNSHHIFGRF